MSDQNTIPEFSDSKRLSIFKMLTSACTHLYSKNKLQKDKFMAVAAIFADLAKNDPVFLAHFTAYANAKLDSKDLRVLSIFFNSLNDANGTPFFKGSKLNKPNFREISSILLQNLDPHLALRVLMLCHEKFEVSGILNHSTHFTTAMKTAFKKYLKYREAHPDMIKGMKTKGLGNKFASIYRLARVAPSYECASILGWKQKQGPAIVATHKLDFTDKTSAEIASEISTKKISPVVALSVIPKEKITTNVAKALLSNATGNQSIILFNWFSENGFMDVESIKTLFAKKVKTATTAVDRIETLTKNATQEDKKVMAEVRSENRKRETANAGIGKVYLHIDASGSMQAAIEWAKERASIIAECVNDPEKNFAWGMFGTSGLELPKPKEFTKEHFFAALYGRTANMGQTDCLALYDKARKFGAEIDIYVTDQGHNVGTINKRIREYHEVNPNLPKPKAVIIIDFGGGGDNGTLARQLKMAEIPYSFIAPNALKESALVAQSIKLALVGELKVIEDIMETPLPTLPKWWNTVGIKAEEKEAESVT